ncbi:MAG: 50S ribosomal protein L16 [Flavobacteriales bacterium]|jgi:large subunit ribosomal protein L16
MLQPKRTKYRKMQKGRVRGLAQRGITIAYGSFGIKTLEVGFISSRQIEASRIAINRYMKREGQVWIRIFPDKPITSKPAEVRMGKGKGAPSHWVAPVRPGRVMFEVDGVPMDTAMEALRLGAQKLPVKCKFVVRPDYAHS